MSKLNTITKRQLVAMLETVPDDAPIFIQTDVHCVGRALTATAHFSESGDPSEVVFAFSGPVAHDMSGTYYLIAEHFVYPVKLPSQEPELHPFYGHIG